MPTSRKLWSKLVTGLGGLWLVGGLFGFAQGRFEALLLVFCGTALVRMGLNLAR